MSMALVSLHMLMAKGGAVLRKYERLMREAEGAQHGSPAELAKRRFEMSWQEDPAITVLEAEEDERLRAMDEAGSA